MKLKRLARKVVYESPWVNLYLDRVQFASGRLIEDYHVLDFEKEAVAALVENGEGQILFVQVYRYATDTLEWEIPAGILETGESALECACREAWEESGYETTDHELIYTYYPLIGMGNKVFHIVRCRATEKTGGLDKDEVASARWFSLPEIRRLLQDKRIRDGFSLTALLLYLQSGEHDGALDPN